MGLRGRVVVVCVAVFSLFACASAAFPYKYYGLDLAGGRLLGPNDKDDLPLTLCDVADEDDTGRGKPLSKCWVVFPDELRRMKTDYIETIERLKECEQGKN